MKPQARLRVLTFDPEPPDNLISLNGTVECNDRYDCLCARCHLDRVVALRRGVRPSRPIPVRRKAA